MRILHVGMKEQNCPIQHSPFGAQGQRETFFGMFSPWENENLGCIHDHLIEEITILFNDVAEYDVDWGELPIAWTETFGSGGFNLSAERRWTYNHRQQYLTTESWV